MPFVPRVVAADGVGELRGRDARERLVGQADSIACVVDEALHQRIVVGEVAVRRRLRHAGASRDRGERDLFERQFEQQLLAGVEECVPRLLRTLVTNVGLIRPGNDDMIVFTAVKSTTRSSYGGKSNTAARIAQASAYSTMTPSPGRGR